MFSTSRYPLYSQAAFRLKFSTSMPFGRRQSNGMRLCQRNWKKFMDKSSWNPVRKLQTDSIWFDSVHCNHRLLCKIAHINSDVNWVIDSMEHALYARFPRLRYYPGWTDCAMIAACQATNPCFLCCRRACCRRPSAICCSRYRARPTGRSTERQY